MKDSLLSGDDSGLENAWDEICVQVQGQQSYYWAAYEDTAMSVVAQAVDKASTLAKQAIWLQTDPGDEWASEGEAGKEVSVGSERDTLPFATQDIVEYLYRDYLLLEAVNWTNSRIRTYLGMADG
jgi:hypothetical protein